ncbi:hypothetical protein H9Q10_11160 [Eikenella sp. S3360]|uniref:SET and RING associated domain-containing protein n=1 Tax=Eikenella glucosivorans TaxID=2766967 RepID=A0ABS0ND81_9NEIS|nr:hypothetical protein [Eikenella glucosivorans]MBH5330221.1 hypothetical protein [Eikenella glucosivorans]
MRDPEFFLHRYAPTTTTLAFLEVPYAELVDFIVQWERKRDIVNEYPTPTRKIDIGGTWEERLNSLLPLNRSKVMVSETQSNWCVYVNNSPNGTDLNADPPYLCEKLGVREIAVTLVRDIPQIKPGSTQFLYEDGTRPEKVLSATGTGWRNQFPYRYIAAHHESRWEFEERGDPLPFEEFEQYQARRIKDRLTPEMVERYCSHFGIDLFNPDFYRGRACVFESWVHPERRKLLHFPNQQG